MDLQLVKEEYAAALNQGRKEFKEEERERNPSAEKRLRKRKPAKLYC